MATYMPATVTGVSAYSAVPQPAREAGTPRWTGWRRLVSATVLSALTVATASGNTQLIVPVDQTRGVFSSARAGDDFYYQVREDFDIAPDFGPFVGSASATAEVTGAAGTSWAWQDSVIGANRIDAAGAETGSSDGWDFNGWGNSDDRSTFEVTFDITAPVRARFFGNLRAYDSAYAEALLVGPQQAIFAALAFGPADDVDFDELLVLAAGEYRVFVGVDGLTWGNMTAPDQSSAEYTVTLLLCPAADLDGNGTIDLSDLNRLLAYYGHEAGMEDGDLDGDGVVGLNDLTILLAEYGSTCSLD